MKEEVVVNSIERQLAAKNRYFNNLHGTMFSKNTGIEAKAPKKSPYTNQWRRAIEILLSGGRYIIAQDDFDLNDADEFKIKTIEIGGEIGYDEFIAEEWKIIGSTEVILRKD